MFVSKLIRSSVLIALVGVGVQGVALADSASTTGGIKIKSDDGNFDASIGGRIHWDAVYLSPYSNSSKVGSGSPSFENKSGAYFRRVFLSLAGHAYGWEYHIDDDLVGRTDVDTGTATTTVTCATGKPNSKGQCTGTGNYVTGVSTSTISTTGVQTNSFNDVWVAHELFPHGTVYLGQHKPWRAYEEIQSNNEILFMERPVTSASGIFGGRDFTQGVYYKWVNNGVWLGASGYALNKASQSTTQGIGWDTRAAWAPINDKGKLLHVGASYSVDNADNANSLKASYNYAGYKLDGALSETLASYAGSLTSNNNASVRTLTGELAGIYGPAYFESEYAHASFGQHGVGGSNVDAFYAQASYFVTGESKSYRASDAVVAGNPKPIHSAGAVELKVRYEYMRNLDANAAGNPGACNLSIKATGTINKCVVTDFAGGINFYVNPNVRFMLDYVSARADIGSAGWDEPKTIALRTQFSF